MRKELFRTDCDVTGCPRKHYAKGWCRLHWERAKRNGGPLEQLVLRGASVAERLHHYSKRVGKCVVWTGCQDRDGYGSLNINGRTVRAHRAAFELENGPIPDGLVIRHKCDNPPCINLEHLEIGTHLENSKDKVERDRSTWGERNAASKLSGSDVLEIRRMADDGASREDIVRKFAVGNSQVSRIVRGESWKRLISGAGGGC